jgi:hypothetical protein
VSLPTRVEALEELNTLSLDIGETHIQLALLLHAEHEAKVRTWFESNSQYVTERDRIAEFNALDLTLDVIAMRGELAAKESRRSFLEYLIEHGEQ